VIRELAKLAVYHAGKEEKKRKRTPKEILESMFSPKYEPEPPPPDERKRLQKGNGEGRGNSGLDELKITSADQAFLLGVQAAFADFEKTALGGLPGAALGAVKGIYNAGSFLGSHVSPWGGGLRLGGDRLSGVIGGVGALSATAAGVGKAYRNLSGERAQPVGPNPTSFFRPTVAGADTGGPFTRQ